MSSFEPGCPFCNPDQRAVLVENEHGRILLARGPLVPGHLLIVSRAHEPSVSASPPTVQAGLARLRRRCDAAFGAVLGCTSLVFEHGASSRTSAAADAHCLHAHQNAIPDRLQGDGFERAVQALRRSGIEPADTLLTSEDYYLLLRGDDRFAGTAGRRPPSRLFRRTLAPLLGLPESEAVAWERHTTAPWESPLASSLKAALQVRTTEECDELPVL